METGGSVDLFVRRIFIRGGDLTILRPWAKFVCGIIESPDLQPTAARDNIQRNDENSTAPSGVRLGPLIIGRLTALAKDDPKLFAKINRWHHYHLKGMATYHDEFFQKVVELLLFDTNQGQISIGRVPDEKPPRPDAGNRSPIYYFPYTGLLT